MPHRIFLAGLFQETSDFSPIPTGRQSFDAGSWVPDGADHPPEGMDLLGYGGAWEAVVQRRQTPIPGPFFSAVPAARMGRPVWDGLTAELLEALRAAGPVDAIFLMLHGAMMADGIDDCEADLVGRMRAMVGPDVRIGAAFDLHGNLSADMLAGLDVAVACKEYPHTDFREAGAQVATILLDALEGQVDPRMLALHVPVLGIAPTPLPPMRAFVQRLQGAEAQPAILAASACTGFFGSDHPGIGGSVLLVTDGDATAHSALADELAAELVSALAAVQQPGLGIEDALDAALAHVGRVVIADRADNSGGGAASDSTFLLEAMLARDVQDAALGMIWDPVAVEMCHAAGEGARLQLRIGGKVGPMSGRPLDLAVEVLAVRDTVRQAWFGRGDPVLAIGRSAAIRAGGIDIVLSSVRHQVFSRHVFEGHGIDLDTKRLIVVKSTAHFRTAFAPLGLVIDCDAPGTLCMDFTQLPYRRRPSPLWPIDPGPVSPRRLYPPQDRA